MNLSLTNYDSQDDQAKPIPTRDDIFHDWDMHSAHNYKLIRQLYN